MRFLHTGDLHLGKKQSSEFSVELCERISSDERQLLLNIILYANENEIPYIFIAGDLFDTNKPDSKLVCFVVSCFERYFGKIFIIPGNHDYYSDDSVYAYTEFPDNTYVLREELSLHETEDAVIYGCGFSSPHKNTNSFSEFYHKSSHKPGILILHSDLKSDSLYNPVDIEDIEFSGISYVAAGHIHIKGKGIKRGKTYINWCGAPQNLNFKETSEASVIVGELTNEFLNISEVSLFCHSYRNVSVDISSVSSEDEFYFLCRELVLKNDPENSLINLEIKGSLRGFEPDFSHLKSTLENICMYIRFEKNYTRKYDIELLKKEKSLQGEYVRQVLSLFKQRDEKFVEKVIEKGMKYL